MKPTVQTIPARGWELLTYVTHQSPAIVVPLQKIQNSGPKAHNYTCHNNNVNLNTYRNMITVTSSNVLTRYFMATFTYNIRTVGGTKKKVGGGGIFGY
ncbi:MAG: hypothetical protein ABI151_15150 [Chitinophagaceae bacterium]